MIHRLRRPRVDSSDEPKLSAKILRPMKVQGSFSPLMKALVDWTVAFPTPDRPVVLVVPAESHMSRNTIFKAYAEGTWRKFHTNMVVDALGPQTGEWRDDGPINNFSSRIERMVMPPYDKKRMAAWYSQVPRSSWEILWGLVAVEDFVVEEPLRGMVDQAFYLVHDVHRILWEARFLAREQSTLEAAKSLIATFSRWMVGRTLTEADQKALSALGIDRLVRAEERLDVLLLLLTLAAHNGLLQRAVFVFDDIDRALSHDRRPVLRQLHAFILATRRWAKLGCPLGVLLGFTATDEDRMHLARLNGKLATEVLLGLEWSHKETT